MALVKLPDKEYRTLAALSQSQISQALSMSPHEWYRRQIDPFVPTPKMKLGTLIHAMVLEPESIEKTFRRVPKLDRRKTEHKALALEFESETRELIDEETWTQAEEVYKVLYDTPKARDIFSGGKSEIAVHGHFFEGEAVKGKLDYLRGDIQAIIDLKTTELDLNDDSLRWTMDQKHYKIQAAFYIDLMRKESLKEDWSFCFFFVNVKSPFEMRKVVVSDALNPDWLEEGRALYREGIERIISWKKEGVYPKLIDLPSYIPQSKPWRNK